MGNLRAGFGRYELGSKEGDIQRIQYMQKLEEKAENATDAFRDIIDRDTKAAEKTATETVEAKK